MKKLSLVFFVAFVSIAFAGNAKGDWQWESVDCEFEKLDNSKMMELRYKYEKLSNGQTYAYQVVVIPKKYNIEFCGYPQFTIIEAKSMQEAHDKLKEAQEVLYWVGSSAKYWVESSDKTRYLESYTFYEIGFLDKLPKQNHKYKGECYQYMCVPPWAQYEWSKNKKQLTITSYITECGTQKHILSDLGNGTFKIVKTIPPCYVEWE
ncbi:hypothetical protein ACWIUD_00370 [Helicobacter sp. 23-1044]